MGFTVIFDGGRWGRPDSPSSTSLLCFNITAKSSMCSNILKPESRKKESRGMQQEATSVRFIVIFLVKIVEIDDYPC